MRLRHCAISPKFVGSVGCGVDSASTRNEYNGYFLGRKGGRFLGLTTMATLMCRMSRNPGILNLLEP
jgi:hypothetical protein